MILDRLDAADRYLLLHRGFAAAVDFLRNLDPRNAPLGHHEIDGQRAFVLISRDEGRGQAGAKLEAHRRYIDLQLCLEGAEVIGWRPLADCHEPEAPHDEGRDIRFFRDRPETWLSLPAGMLAIFFPTDAHAPLAGAGPVLKAVAKIAVDW